VRWCGRSSIAVDIWPTKSSSRRPATKVDCRWYAERVVALFAAPPPLRGVAVRVFCFFAEVEPSFEGVLLLLLRLEDDMIEKKTETSERLRD